MTKFKNACAGFFLCNEYLFVTSKMADKCKLCKKNVSSRIMKINCNDCESPFHASCVKLEKEEVEFFQSDNNIWRCDSCAKTRRKSMAVESELNKGNPNLNDVLDLLNVIRAENKEQTKNLEKELGKSVNSCHENIEELKTVLKEQSDKIDRYEKKIDELLNQNTNLRKRVRDLEIGLDEAEQYSRINCLEISGVPDKVNEDVVTEVKKVGEALGVTITDDMIDACHRLGRKQDKWPRAIIVKFSRRSVKEEMLQKRRVKRNFNTTHIGERNSPGKVIYINESLTKARRELHKQVRELKKKKGLSFIWIRNGNILVRPNEGDPVIAVTTMEDLKKLQNLPDGQGTHAVDGNNSSVDT